MTSWGDYAVTAVQYNYDETEIKQVKRRDVGEDALSSATTIDRSTVVSDIESGTDYTTALKKDNGKWALGEEIHVVKINGEKFIRTDQNETEEDNLEDLPTF